MNILQEIFRDHFEEMLYTLHPRSSVVENVDKMINCGDPSFGGAMYSIDRTTEMSFKIINVQHRHGVFTIAEKLRPFFLADRSLLNCLFRAVRSVVLRMFHRDNKTFLFTPGFIYVLHTFGRDLKWNPHIHCLISEGGLGSNGLWRHKKHFNYRFLWDSFQTALLNELHCHLGDSFKKVKSSVYHNHKNGFYVYAKPNICDPKVVIKYIGRYLGRPVIATSRIDAYDEDFVTFHYNRHEDNVLVTERVPVMEFIERLILHVPEKHFKMIRYYGLYARPRKESAHLHHAISKEKHKIYRSFIRWRDSILLSFGYDPLICPCCGKQMSFLELRFRHQQVSLHDLYERTMARAKGRPPDYSVFLQSAPSMV